MSVLSKFFGDVLGFKLITTNCYETAHTWEPDCTKAIQVAVPNGFLFCLRTYGTLYILTHLAAARLDPRRVRWQRVLLATLQSSAFLTTNLILYVWFMCRLRHLMGFWIWPMLGLTNGLLSSFFAIFVEKKSRRPALALYLTNLASETLFRQAVNHGYAKFIPNGQWVVFSAGLSLFFYLKAKGWLGKDISGVLSTSHRLGSAAPLPPSVLRRLPSDLHSLLLRLRNDYQKTNECEHEHSCVAHALEGCARNFSIGLAVGSALTILKNLRSLWMAPRKIVSSLLSAGNLRIPFFFGLLPLLFNAVLCSLNRALPGHSVAKQVVAGAASGVAMRAFPNVTIAMYTLWKAIEALHSSLRSRGLLPSVPHGDILLYTISTGYVLSCAIIEPQAMRSGYYKFLMGLTGDRLAVFNRALFSGLGFDSARLYPGFHPRIDPRHASLNPMLYQPITPP